MNRESTISLAQAVLGRNVFCEWRKALQVPGELSTKEVLAAQRCRHSQPRGGTDATN